MVAIGHSIIPQLSLARDFSQQPAKRIVKLVGHAFLERNDGVICDRDIFRTDLRAAFGDVAVADACFVLDVLQAIACIQRMHL